MGKWLHEWWMKIAVGLGSLAVLAFVSWLQSNIVLAGDLEPIAEAVKSLAEQSKEQQDEWRCSELEEELQGYYDRQEAGQAYTQRDIDRMERIKDRMGVENLNCARFED